MAVRLALGETHLLKENKDYFELEGVDLNALESSKAKGDAKGAGERSKTVILVKNLPFSTEATELAKLFGAFGDVSDSFPHKSFTGVLYGFPDCILCFCADLWVPQNTQIGGGTVVRLYVMSSSLAAFSVIHLLWCLGKGAAVVPDVGVVVLQVRRVKG